jgi:hypothetical protein
MVNTTRMPSSYPVTPLGVVNNVSGFSGVNAVGTLTASTTIAATPGGDVFNQFAALPPPAPTLTGWAALRHKASLTSMANTLKRLPNAPSETPEQQQAMLNAVYLALPGHSHAAFKRLLTQGTLSLLSDENQHSTLYHLHQRLVQPIHTGFNRQTVLATYIKLLDRPYAVSQKPAPLLPSYAKAILAIEKNPIQMGRAQKTVYVQRNLTRKDINVNASFDCTASAVLFGMLEQQPSELIRQLNGLTSPQRAFQKTVRLSDVDKTSPEKAKQLLNAQYIPYRVLSDNLVQLTVKAPEQVLLRAQSDLTRQDRNPRYRDGLQTLYEMTLLELVDPNGYDEADGHMVAEDGSDPGSGLAGNQVDLMSSLVEGRGGTSTATVQLVDSPKGQSPSPDNRPCLLGYTLPLEQTEALLVQALAKGVMPMVGVVYVDEKGQYAGGHYLRVGGSYIDKTTGERQFVMADSDDGMPTTSTLSARQLIPMINRLHLPSEDSERANKAIEPIARSGQILIPDAADKTRYDIPVLYQDTPTTVEVSAQ